MDDRQSRYVAISEGILVVLILGSTLVFAKMALDYMGPLTLTGLRYFLAFLLLFSFVLRRRAATPRTPQLWLRLFFIGLSFYAIGNGALFWGLKYIPATTGSLLLSLTPLLVLGAGVLWLQEIPTLWQMLGVVVGLAGSALFFSPGFKAGEPLGLGIVAIGLVGSASFSLLGRSMARDQQVDTLFLTAIPLAVGSGILLPVALLIEGLPGASIAGWRIVLGLAVVNTALVYMLYNHALKVLAAFEMSVITNLTPLVTAVWAWVLLSERLSGLQWIGMATVIVGVVLVQYGRKEFHPTAADYTTRVASSKE
jgi:drug/metabolite transporter (DMT)-like permease